MMFNDERGCDSPLPVFSFPFLADAANEAVALFNIPENAARLKGPEQECKRSAALTAACNIGLIFPCRCK